MTRRKLDERNIRKITKMAGGASYGITLPIEYIRELKWKARPPRLNEPVHYV